MVFNTSSAEILDRALDRNTHAALIKQILYASMGCLGGILIWQLKYDHLLKLSIPVLLFISLFLILVFVPGIGQMRNGARRWIGVGGLTFQPSEFVKFLLPMVYIELFSNIKEKPISFKSFLKMMGLLGIPIFLVMIEPDNGTAAVMGTSLLPLFFMTKVPLRFWAIPVLVVALLGILAAYQLPYVRSRLQVYLNPELDLKGKGHQPYQAKIAAGSGKLMGKGPGGSLQKLTYLPEAQNDYIAAIYAEEFGFIGMMVLVGLYMVMAFAGYSIAMNAKEPMGCYLGMALTFLISLQAFLNLGVVSGLLPSKGVNLPFFSQGGTSLIANILAMTLLLRIDEKKDYPECRGDRGTSLSRPGCR